MEGLYNYEKIKYAASNYYNNIGDLYSPAFKEKVAFSAEGFNHIVYKTARTERERTSQILRFRLLSLARKLIEISTTYQEYDEKIKEFNIKKHKKRINIYKQVKYWGIIAIIENRKIKVILRKIGENGKMHFWSIVPAWTTNKYRDAKFVTTMKGNPEED
jgi:hypothetical protein